MMPFVSFSSSPLVCRRLGTVAFASVSSLLAQTPIAPPDNFQTDDRPVLVGFAPASAEPFVDAVREPEFYRTRFYIRRIPNYTDANHHAPDNTSDLLGTISGAYTDQGLYIYLEVIDDLVFVDSLSQPWEDDNIEILIDPDQSRNGRFDGVNDSKYVVELKGNGVAEIVQGVFPAPAEGGDWSRFDAAFQQTTAGYEVEFFFPWEGLQVYPKGLWRMGIDVEINDDDGLGFRESWITLSSNDYPNLVTDRYATAELWADRVAESVPMPSDTSVEIDGQRDSSYGIGLAYGSTGRPGLREAPLETETAVTWTALHDESALYLFFEVTDSDFKVDSGDTYRDDDSLELMLGGTQNAILALAPQADGSVAIHSVGESNVSETPDLSGVEAAYAISPEGWNLEVKMPLAVCGVTAATEGDALDFDFQLFDDDDGETGDHSLSWNAGVDPAICPDLWGSLAFLAPAATTIPRTFDSIAIGPNIVEPAFATASWDEIERPIKGQTSPLPPNNVFGAWWAAVHDDAFLYLVAEINDNRLETDSANNLEADDGLQIVFGGEIGGLAEAGWIEPFTLRIRPKLTGGVTLEQPDNTNFDAFEADSWRTDLGYMIKARIPFAALGLSPAGNTTIGMDLRVFDDRDGGDIEHVKSWSSIASTLSATLSDGLGRVLLDPDTLASRDRATRHTNGWFLSSWLGWFNEDANHRGWIYHQGFRWLYPGNTGAHGMPFWFYSPTLGSWIYLRESTFPNVWIADGRGWAYYAIFDPGVGFLYLRKTGTWLEL